MAQVVIMTKISSHGKQRQGMKYPTGASANRTMKDGGMYTFVYGTGSNRVSETRHMTEQQAKLHKSQLEGK